MSADLKSELKNMKIIFEPYSLVSILPFDRNSESHILFIKFSGTSHLFSLFPIARGVILKQALLCMHNKNPSEKPHFNIIKFIVCKGVETQDSRTNTFFIFLL